MTCNKKQKHYTKEDDELLRKFYPTMRAADLAIMIGRSDKSVIGRANKLGLKKDRDFMIECSKAGQFKKGQTPPNKGKKWDDYLSKEQQERSRSTLFGKGHMPHNHVPVGTEVKTTDGYWKVKVGEPKEWKFKHIMLWEEHHGAVPEGMLVYFIDGDKDNITIENLAMTDRKGHRDRTIGCLPLEVRQLIQLKGALRRQLNKIGDSNEDNR